MIGCIDCNRTGGVRKRRSSLVQYLCWIVLLKMKKTLTLLLSTIDLPAWKVSQLEAHSVLCMGCVCIYIYLHELGFLVLDKLLLLFFFPLVKYKLSKYTYNVIVYNFIC